MIPGSTWLREAIVPGVEQVEFRASLETLQPPHAENVEPSQLLSGSVSMCICRPGYWLCWTVGEDEPVCSEGQHLLPINCPTCQVLPTFEDLLVFHHRFESVSWSTTVRSKKSFEGHDWYLKQKIDPNSKKKKQKTTITHCERTQGDRTKELDFLYWIISEFIFINLIQNSVIFWYLS